MPRFAASLCTVLALAWFCPGINAQTVDSFSPAADQPVYTVTAQLDGRILVGGEFKAVNGQSLYNFGRLNPDGTIDQTFNSGFKDLGLYTWVNCTAIQTNGQIWVGGQFSEWNRENLLRLNADGTLDTNFDGGFLGPGVSVFCMDFQPDGKLVVCGSFTEMLSKPLQGLARLNADGSLDASFQPNPNNFVSVSALQPDGKIVVAGNFTSIGGGPCSLIGRLNRDGTLDTNFNASVPRGLPVECLLVQPDGKILIGGLFMSLDGQSRTNLARLNSDGSLDTSFNPQPDDHNSWGISSLLLQTDGKILVGGDFVTMKGIPKPNLARLNSDGTLDTNFDAEVGGNAAVSLAVENDEHILTGGWFYDVGGVPHGNIARFRNADTPTQSLAFDGTNITWLRGGSSIEVSRTTFDVFDGTNWTSLGAGMRIPGGWQLANVSLATNSTIRARGFLTGGKYNGSSFYLESTLPPASAVPPTILVNDGSFGFQSNRFGFNISAASGQTIVVEASADMTNWMPLQTNTFQSSSFYFTDSYETNLTYRLYRARRP